MSDENGIYFCDEPNRTIKIDLVKRTIDNGNDFRFLNIIKAILI